MSKNALNIDPLTVSAPPHHYVSLGLLLLFVPLRRIWVTVEGRHQYPTRVKGARSYFFF